MKSSNTLSLNSFGTVPSLFQIAALFEDFFPADRFRQPVTPLNHLPIAEYMVNPEKLLQLLRSGRTENSAVASPEKSQSAAKNTPRGDTAKKASNRGAGKLRSPQPDPVRKVEFSFESPQAKSVKLAGDFTNWEMCPIDMLCSSNGTWSTVVPLSPGTYSYRFIVNGEWCDDPGSKHHSPNPFGGRNAIIHVT